MTISPVDTMRLTRKLQEAGLTKTQSEEIAIYFRDVSAIAHVDLARRGEVERLHLALGDGIESMRKDFEFVLSEVVSTTRLWRGESTSLQARIIRQSTMTNRLLAFVLLVMLVVLGVVGLIGFDAVRPPLHHPDADNTGHQAMLEADNA